MLNYSTSTRKIRCSSAASALTENAIAFWDNRCAQHRAMSLLAAHAFGHAGDGEGRRPV